jgi:hypothetical protein
LPSTALRVSASTVGGQSLNRWQLAPECKRHAEAV